MDHFIDENDSDGEIPELDLSITIQPQYMFEPLRTGNVGDNEESSSESSNDDFHSNPDNDHEALPENTDGQYVDELNF